MAQSTEELVAAALRLFDDVPGRQISEALGGQISQPDISRWRRGTGFQMKSAKKRLLASVVYVWEDAGLPVGLEGLEEVSRQLGLHRSERVKTLIRWISHPDIFPPEIGWPTRFLLADRTMKVDGYTAAERSQFMAWRREISEAMDGAGTRDARRS